MKLRVIVNNIYVLFNKVWFYWFVDASLRKRADDKYRLVQNGERVFEIQCYQNVAVSSYSGETGYSKFKWTPLLVKLGNATKDDYIAEVQKLRWNEYLRLKSDYLKKIEMKKLPKYPRVIY